MNKKVTVKRPDGKITYCILSGEESLVDQFNRFFFGSPKPGHGMCARVAGSEIAIVDYYHNEKMSTFQIIGIEDTDSEPVLKWIDV